MLTDFEGRFPLFFYAIGWQAEYQPFKLSRREPGVNTPIFKKRRGCGVNKQVTEAFDALADRYEKETDGIRPYNAYYERPAMMAMLPDDLSGMDVLDAGCAAGWYSEQLLRLGARVTAVDASPRMVEAAKRRLGDRVDVRLHNLEDPLPFEAEQFDWIVCSLSLHYLLDWAPVLSEFARVLKSGGRLLFSTHHPFMDYMQFD
nr:methyltransferase domain-containing protein [Polycladomyces sp. WAk]